MKKVIKKVKVKVIKKKAVVDKNALPKVSIETKAAPKAKKKVIKISDPRMVELQKQQASLAAEEKRIQAVIKAEKKAIADAEKKVSVAVKGLTSDLVSVKKAVSVFGAAVMKSKNEKGIDKANSTLMNVLQSYGDRIDHVNRLQQAVLILVNGEPEEEIDDL